MKIERPPNSAQLLHSPIPPASAKAIERVQKGAPAASTRCRCLRRQSRPVSRRHSATSLRLGHMGRLPDYCNFFACIKFK
ncbi:hypothetical protein TNCV_3846021 [Trichonephila clavipes]|nr:hypothetical protein TNCV_3846021 [Trichonephila clavipes]